MTSAAGTGRRRVAWGVADQLAASGANFLVVVLAARSLGAGAFGAFVVGLTMCMVGMVLSRGIASDVVSSVHAADPPKVLHEAQRAGLATVVTAAGLASALAVAVGLSTSGLTRDLAFVVAAVLPGVLVQDYLRIALIVSGRARGAFLNDAAWGVVQVPALLVADAMSGGAAGLLLAWGAVGTGCALAGIAQTRVLPHGPRRTLAWLRRHRGLWPYLLLDNGVAQAANLGTVLVVSLVSDLAEVGAMRVATTVFAPMIVLGRGVATVAVPEVVRRGQDPRRVRRIAVLLGCALAPLAAVGALVGLLLPQAVGEALFGDTWTAARPLLLLTSVGVAGGLFSVGIFVGLRALAAGRHGLTARIVVTSLLLLACLVGAWWNDAKGAVLLLALVTPLQVGAWWHLLRRASQSGTPRKSGTSLASASEPASSS